MTNNAFDSLASYLTNIGLGGLFNVDSQGNPSGWLWNQIQNGVDSKEALLMALEQTPEFKQRFSIIFELRDRAAKGENVAVPTTQQVLDYEDKFRAVMSRAGVPSWFYDQPSDAHSAMRSNLTVDQVSERINVSYGIVNQMPKEVRDIFSEYFGDATDSALVAAVLDPQKTLASLEKATRASVAGGFARQQGFEISSSQALAYAERGRNLEQVQSDIANVAQKKPLETATMGEAQTIQPDAAFQAEAMGNVGAQQALESRLTTRRLGQAQSAGGAFTSQEGVVGAGSAR